VLGVFGRSKSMDDRDKTRSGDAHAQVKNYVLHGYDFDCSVVVAARLLRLLFFSVCLFLIPLQILYLL